MSTGRCPSAAGFVHAPDFSLSDHLGAAFRLHEHLAGGPLLIVFFRGHWCPYCRRYLGKLRDHWPRLRERGARIVAISPEPPATSRVLVTELGLPFPALSDPDGRVIDAFGARNGFASARAVLPHASAFLVDSDGVVRAHSIDRNYKKRTTVRTILGWLDELGATGASAPDVAAPDVARRASPVPT